LKFQGQVSARLDKNATWAISHFKISDCWIVLHAFFCTIIRENGIGMFHYHFDGHQGALCVLKWGILQAKLFFIPLKCTKEKCMGVK